MVIIMNTQRNMVGSPREKKMCVTGTAIASLVNASFFLVTIW